MRMSTVAYSELMYNEAKVVGISLTPMLVVVVMVVIFVKVTVGVIVTFD